MDGYSDRRRTESVSPAYGVVIGHSDLNHPSDVRKAVERARSAQPAWAAMSVKARAKLLRPLSAYLSAHADELADTISRDNGKTRTDAMAAEVLPAAMATDYYCRKARAMLKDRRIMPGSLIMANKASRIVRVPYGVIGIISPWNYPFSIPFSEVVMALLAGNAVILKAASETQMVGRAIERCFNAMSLPPGLFQYVNLPETPWGGFKQSGLGRTHGAVGMAEMTQPQCLVHDHLPGVKRNLWWHPHGPAVYRGMRGILSLLYGRGLAPRLKGLGSLLWIVPRMFTSSVRDTSPSSEKE